MEIKSPTLQMLYRDLLTLIMELDKRETSIHEREKQLEKKMKQIEKQVTKQDIMVEAEKAVEPLKEIISCYLLKYSYIPYKNSVSYSLQFEQEGTLVLHVIFEKDRLKIYYTNDTLIVYSSGKELYHTSLKGALMASNYIYDFIDVSKKCMK